MSNSENKEKLDDLHIEITPDNFIPHGGYGIIFSEEMAQRISEFVASDFYKLLKKTYPLQKKDKIARQALQGANNTEWLHYFKGMAAAVDLFFQDMEAVHKEFVKANSDEDDKPKGEAQFKK